MSWGEIFNRWKRKGFDPSYAAWKADQYEARKNREVRLIAAAADEKAAVTHS
jgi:hypothetical protein